MAIDLCNKGMLLQSFAAGAQGRDYRVVGLDEGVIPFSGLTAEQQDACRIQTKTTAALADSRCPAYAVSPAEPWTTSSPPECAEPSMTTSVATMSSAFSESLCGTKNCPTS